MQLPPIRNVLELLQQTAVPALAGATLTMCLMHAAGRLLASVISTLAVAGRFCWAIFVENFSTAREIGFTLRWKSYRWLLNLWQALALGSALGVTSGFIWANFSLDNSIDRETGALLWWNTYRLLPWMGEPASRYGWDWLALAALILVGVGLVTHWLRLLSARFAPDRRGVISLALVWLPRIIALYALSGWPVSERVASESPALRWEILLIMLASWGVLDRLARLHPGPEIVLDQGIMCIAAGIVVLFAHSARFMEVMMALGGALVGVSLVAFLVKSNVTGAIPAAVIFLPGLMLAGRSSLSSRVPDASFWLVALSPLMLLPWLLPLLARKKGWYPRAIRMAMVLVPLILAVALAAQYEELPFTNE